MLVQHIATLAASALLLSACGEVPGEAGGGASAVGPELTGDTEEAVNPQDTPVSLPHSAPFHMNHHRLLGHPFHLGHHAQVTVTASAQWVHRLCPIHTYAVTITETGILPKDLGFKNFPTGGASQVERWEAPLDGEYRLEVMATDHPGCLPLDGTATITSP
jgi:hypothetical protein